MENHGIKIIHNPMLSKMKNGLPTHPLLHFLAWFADGGSMENMIENIPALVQQILAY
jgi:hypothetical protein